MKSYKFKVPLQKNIGECVARPMYAAEGRSESNNRLSLKEISVIQNLLYGKK